MTPCCILYADLLLNFTFINLFLSSSQAHYGYFGTENVIEWFCYVAAILTVYDFSECTMRSGLRENWQWQLGAITVTMSWLNLLSNVRKFPFLGIYVVMFTDVMQTFLKFSIICALFVIAFSLGFHTLICKQDTFREIAYAMMKTTVMMIGEFEFDSVFFEYPSRDPSVLPYRPVTLLFFLAFMVIMPIIIMNLLVGLAVDDIKGVQENAVLSRLAMQVSLNLDVEKMLPDFLRRRFIIRQENLFPNIKRNILSKILKDDNTVKRIARDVVEGGGETEINQLSNKMDDVTGEISLFKDEVKRISEELSQTNRFLELIANNLGVQDNDDG